MRCATTMTEKFEGLRDYQLEVFNEITNRKSCILFLPAGSGKTRIAFTVIKSMAEDLKRPIAENGKRTFFLVNTLHLVGQQGAVLSQLGDIRVSGLTREMSCVAYSKKDRWTTLLSSFEVFVVTSQIFLNALIHGYFVLENVNLLIFDECHHATGDHPMAQIMTRIRQSHPESRPKILGLTATLFKANVKNTNKDFKRKLEELKRIFDAEIITSRKSKQIRNRFSAKPAEIIQNAKRYRISDHTQEKLKILSDEIIEMVRAVRIRGDGPPKLIDQQDERSNLIQFEKADSSRLKQFKNVLNDILFHTHEYGLFMGYTCCQYYIMQLSRFVMSTNDSGFSSLLLYTITQARLMRKILFNDVLLTNLCENSDTIETTEMIQSTSSGKIQCLFNRIRTIKPSDRCIVFVEKKMTAKSLHKILKIFIEESMGNTITVDFTTGANKNPLRNTNDGNRTKKEIFKKFSNGLLNVLVATNVLEEGIDVQECNLVIMFDGVKTFTSYIQSRGRARMQGSEYIILNHDTTTDTQIDFFKEINLKLDELMRNHLLKVWKKFQEMTIDLLINGFHSVETFDTKDEPVSFVSDDGPDTNRRDNYTTSKGVTVDSVSAIQIIRTCCSTLSGHLSLDSMPQWYYDSNRRICYVKLPPSWRINSVIEGPRRLNRKEARQATALEVVIRLHEEGILDEYLNPVMHPSKINNSSCASSDTDEDISAVSPLTNKTIHSSIRVSVFLKNCRPVPMLQCYLHCLTFTSEDEMSIERHQFVHELMRCPEYNFGILTRQKWPEICTFPVYSDLGEIHVKLQSNYQMYMFPAFRLNQISNFHRTLFVDVLKGVRKCFSFNNSENCDDGYYIVPLRRNEETMNYEISWTHIEAEFPTEIPKPTPEEIDEQKYTARNYIGKVVTQWYNSQGPHIVYDMSDNVFLRSPFLSSTYEKYYREKYGVISRRPTNQPMLLVRPIVTLTDSIRPKCETGKVTSRKKAATGGETYLAPEFCYVYPFPAVFWYKSTVLPSTLHRIHHLLLAEDLRQRIVVQAEVGTLQLPKDEIPTRALEFKEGNKRKDFIIEPVLRTPVKVRKCVSKRLYKLLHPKRKEAVDNKTEKLQSTGHEHNVTINTDIEKFDKSSSSPTTLLVDALHSLRKSVDCPDLAFVAILKTKTITDDGRFAPLFKKSSSYEPPDIIFTVPPELSTLKNLIATEHGPKSHEILEAITLRDAQDVFHLERLETLGDSCLKYLVSFYLYTKGENMDEGDLTILKSELVSNKNLFNCGEKLDIGSYIKVINFSTKSFWCPPGFHIPSCFMGSPLTEDTHVKEFSSLLTLDIPRIEQFHGKISETTKNQEMKNTDVDNINSIKEIDFLLGRNKLSPKNISDVLEALLGVYSLKAGIKNAFKLLHYFGVLKDLGDFIPRGIPHQESTSVYAFLPKLACDSIERLTKYQFKNKAHLLQAFTHASFTDNSLTDSYEKFEFLGDAILDFLITSFLYEYHQHLDPGQLTDLRSALVNNITFGSLTVRLGLHQFLLCRSDALLEAVGTFVTHQRKRNHAIANEFMVVRSENNNVFAEEIDVPKVLGDIFESLAAAIFIDSGFDLGVVWNIYFNFMRNEIKEFSKKIPINPVRELYEKMLKLDFSTTENNRNGGKIMILLKVVTPKKKIFQFTGRGESTKAAKRAVARFALKNLNNDAFLVK